MHILEERMEEVGTEITAPENTTTTTDTLRMITGIWMGMVKWIVRICLMIRPGTGLEDPEILKIQMMMRVFFGF